MLVCLHASQEWYRFSRRANPAIVTLMINEMVEKIAWRFGESSLQHAQAKAIMRDVGNSLTRSEARAFLDDLLANGSLWSDGFRRDPALLVPGDSRGQFGGITDASPPPGPWWR